MFFEQRITKKCTTDTSFAGVSFRQPEKYIVKQKSRLTSKRKERNFGKLNLFIIGIA